MSRDYKLITNQMSLKLLQYESIYKDQQSSSKCCLQNVFNKDSNLLLSTTINTIILYYFKPPKIHLISSFKMQDNFEDAILYSMKNQNKILLITQKLRFSSFTQVNQFKIMTSFFIKGGIPLCFQMNQDETTFAYFIQQSIQFYQRDIADWYFDQIIEIQEQFYATQITFNSSINQLIAILEDGSLSRAYIIIISKKDNKWKTIQKIQAQKCGQVCFLNKTTFIYSHYRRLFKIYQFNTTINEFVILKIIEISYQNDQNQNFICLKNNQIVFNFEDQQNSISIEKNGTFIFDFLVDLKITEKIRDYMSFSTFSNNGQYLILFNALFEVREIRKFKYL